jgi:hypothetical protein
MVPPGNSGQPGIPSYSGNMLKHNMKASNLWVKNYYDKDFQSLFHNNARE